MITNNDIRRFLNLPEVDREIKVSCVDALGIHNNTLMFINKSNVDIAMMDESMDCVYLINESYGEVNSDKNDFIRVDNPKFKFCKVVERFDLHSRLQLDYLLFDPLQVVKRAIYEEYVHCYEALIGNGCQFDKGVIIGGTDFSPVLGDNPNELVQFPQMGGVIIGDNVVIKYHSMIGKGTFIYTKIGHNTMIDYGCQIGHNCKIGNSCIIAAGTIIGGSTTIGDNTVIGIGALIRNGLTIGKNVSIGMGSVVIRDIPDNSVVVGNPAHIIEHKKIFDQGGLV